MSTYSRIYTNESQVVTEQEFQDSIANESMELLAGAASLITNHQSIKHGIDVELTLNLDKEGLVEVLIDCADATVVAEMKDEMNKALFEPADYLNTIGQ